MLSIACHLMQGHLRVSISTFSSGKEIDGTVHVNFGGIQEGDSYTETQKEVLYYGWSKSTNVEFLIISECQLDPDNIKKLFVY